ncbi:DUF6177 family protein [Streptomyces sp. NBC_01750]|uniref:DUF6177 family protein n=1 Tax=Streptomyces sp. NBC_01750 TaxID=2975928 RepID=UPI002DDABAB3|nr:DUF6177 family protein [Streptomyces sp. NBC_01750]WSD36403.1 DUF6177 family protein [Streptomyces sp. NBC_01750]
MTKDVIALTPTMPDIRTLLAGLYAGGPDVRVDSAGDGAVVQLRAPGGHPLISVEAPIFVQVPGEASRLLGTAIDDAQGPFWWTETRSTTAVPDAESLARAFAGRLVSVLGGTTWPPGPVTTDIVPLTSDNAQAPATDTSPPGIDVLTDQAAVVIQDRPVVAMSSWLSDALRTAATTSRALQIVTPHTTRLTVPTRTALQGHPNRWIVQDPEHGYYDGLSGAALRWHNGAFTPIRTHPGPVPAFTEQPVSGDRQLIVSLRTQHAPDAGLLLGGALETTWQQLTGAPPTGWSTAEPVNLPWSTRQLTDLARTRAPRPTWLIAVGHPDRPAIATQRITRTTAGVEEDITLALGYGPVETPPLDTIQPLAEVLVSRHNLTSMLTSLRPGRRDLTVPPHFEKPPVPVTFTLGAGPVSDIGFAHASRPPLNLHPIQLGPTAAPALHYPLGDSATTWGALQQLTTHLTAAREK